MLLNEADPSCPFETLCEASRIFFHVPSQAEAAVVLLDELLLSVFGAHLREFVPFLLLALVSGRAAHVAEVSQVLHRVVLLQIRGDGLEAQDRQGIGAGPFPLSLFVFLHQLHRRRIHLEMKKYTREGADHLQWVT